MTKSESDGDADRPRLGKLDVEEAEEGLEEAGDDRFPEKADGETGEGDTELPGREIGIEILCHPPREFHGVLVPAVLQFLLELARADTHEGEFSRHEKRVEENEEEDEADLQSDIRQARPFLDHFPATAGKE